MPPVADHRPSSFAVHQLSEIIPLVSRRCRPRWLLTSPTWRMKRLPLVCNIEDNRFVHILEGNEALPWSRFPWFVGLGVLVTVTICSDSPSVNRFCLSEYGVLLVPQISEELIESRCLNDWRIRQPERCGLNLRNNTWFFCCICHR